MSFKIIAQPALNKQGFAKLTFKGYQEVEAQFDADTGEQTKRAYTKLLFTVMDTTRKSPINANVIGGALTGNFLTALTALGFELPTPELAEDNDGFSVETMAVDEDGFEIADVDEEGVVANLKAHLTSVIDSNYLAKVAKNKRGYWEIDINSIKPLA
jgi:hypothetical protein